MIQIDTHNREWGKRLAPFFVLSVSSMLLLLAFSLLSGCETSKPTDQQARNVRFFLFNNAGGEVDPCGCPGNPAGGFAKRVGFLGGRSDDQATGPIVVDAGDLIDRRGMVPFDQREEARLRARLAVRVLNLTKTDVFVPGDGDLGIGWETFYKSFQNAEFQILTANLYDYFMDRQAFPGSVVLERDGVRVGLIGLVSYDLTRGLDSVIRKEIRVDDPVEAATKEVARLRNEVDLLVVVAHLSRMELERVATEIPGIDLIFSGHHQSYFISKAKAEGGPMIFQTGKGGQKAGSLQVSLLNKTRPIRDHSEKIRLEKRLASMKRDIDALEMGNTSKEQKQDEAYDVDLKDKNKNILDEYNKLRAELQSIDTGNIFLFELITLGNRVSSNPKVEGWVTDYKRATHQKSHLPLEK